jgi:plasmid stabilization system protein ParE
MQKIDKPQQQTESTAIASLQSEIETRQVDIANLREAIATLKAGKPRPLNPSADNAFNLLKEIVGAVPQRLEDQKIYDEKLVEADRALQLAVNACEEKVTELKSERSVERSQQSNTLVDELVAKAEKFNAAIDAAVELLAEMKTINSQVLQLRRDHTSVFTITADLNEIPYCRIARENVLVGRRFDLKR